MRQKMHKYEVGKSRPTEKRASNALINDEADKWVAKIDKAASTYGADIPFKIKAVTEVLAELTDKIRGKEVDFEVMRVVLRRRNVSASVELLLHKHR